MGGEAGDARGYGASSGTGAVRHVVRPDDDVERARDGLELDGLVRSQLAVDVEPHAGRRIDADAGDLVEHDGVVGEVVAGEDERAQARDVQGGPGADDDDVEQAVLGVGARRDGLSARRRPAVRDDDVEGLDALGRPAAPTRSRSGSPSGLAAASPRR